MLKKTIIMSITLSALLTGCAFKNEQAFVKNNFNITKPKEIDQPIETIYVDHLVKVSDNLSHEMLEDNFVTLDIKKQIKLIDIGKYINIPVRIDIEVERRTIPTLQYEGSLKKFLDKIASYTGTYWRYDEGVVVFQQTKTMYFSIPSLTPVKLSSIYNIGNNRKTPFEIDKIKKDIFDELEKAFISIYSEGRTVGTIVRKLEYQKSIKKEDSKQGKSDRSSSDNRIETHNLLNKKIAAFDKSKVTSSKNQQQDRKEGTSEVGVHTARNNFVIKGKQVKTKQLKNMINNKDMKNILNFNKEDKEFISNNRTTKNKTLKNDDKREKEMRELKSHLSVSNTKKRDNSLDSVEIVTKKEYGYRDNFPFSISKETGLITVVVDRNIESRVTGLVRSLVKDYLSNIVDMEMYILEVDFKKLKSINSKLSGSYRNRNAHIEGNFDIDKGLYTNFGYLLNHGMRINYSISDLVNLLTQDSSGRIIQRAHLFMLPSIPSRIKSTIDYPYLEPQQISVGGTDSQLSYNIKYVSDGLDMGVVANVLGQTVIVSLGISLNQYLGKETVQAGQLGTFDLPLQSPRTLNTTMRIKAGEVVLLGGLKKALIRRKNGSNFFIPEKFEKEISKNEILIVARPKIIKFVERDPNKKDEYITKMMEN